MDWAKKEVPSVELCKRVEGLKLFYFDLESMQSFLIVAEDEDEDVIKEVEEVDEESEELEHNDEEVDEHMVDEEENQQIQIPSVEGELPEEVISVKDKYDDKDRISTEEI